MKQLNQSTRTLARMKTQIALALALASCLLFVTPVKASTDEQGNGSGPEGTWLVRVRVVDAPPGFPVPFDALETYSRGGGVVTTNNNPLVPRPGQGAWTRRGEEYAVRIIFFLFDPAGTGIGTVEVTHRFDIKGDHYRGVGEAQFKDLDGNPLFPEHPQPFTFTTRAQRVIVEDN